MHDGKLEQEDLRMSVKSEKGNIYVLEDLHLKFITASGKWLQTKPYKAPIAKVVDEHFDTQDGSMSYRLRLVDGQEVIVGKYFLARQKKVEDLFK